MIEGVSALADFAWRIARMPAGAPDRTGFAPGGIGGR
jgi:hypothetical protein